jgi:hypothetical protein
MVKRIYLFCAPAHPTLLEAGELKRQAYGTEINFAAVCLSKIYELINVGFPERIVLFVLRV